MKIGTTQDLRVDHISGPGAFLKEDDSTQTVLLPSREVPAGLKDGDKISVFLYKDSEDRPVATLKKPDVQLGEVASLKAISTTKIGAFLDWGLEKDLLMPYSEQLGQVVANRRYPIYLYLDKSGRLAATMKIYDKLSSESPFKKGDWTEGIVYQINPDVGAFIAVDGKYNGMIRKEDINDEVRLGHRIPVRVAGVTPDGKLTLSPIKKAYKEIPGDAEMIYRKVLKNGFLPFNDKSAASAIKAEFGISKSAFKKAIGRLLKENKITQSEKGIRLK